MIYEILCNETNERYIGSTFQTLNLRIRSHKCPSNGTMSKGIIDRGNFTFKILEELPNSTKNELLLKEKEYFLKLECINVNSPLTTIEERKAYNLEKANKFYKDNKEYVLNNRKVWYNENKENVSKIRKQKHLCICGMYYTIHNKSRHEQSKKHLNFTQDNN